MPEIIGRDAELARLHACYQTACPGKRQIVLVAGAPGIGKTTLLNAFLAALEVGHRVAASVADDRAGHALAGAPRLSTPASIPALAHCTPKPRVARGQCIELYGATEAYLPIFEALDRVCRQRDGAPVIDLLEREAPGWLTHLTLCSATKRKDPFARRDYPCADELCPLCFLVYPTRPMTLANQDRSAKEEDVRSSASATIRLVALCWRSSPHRRTS